MPPPLQWLAPRQVLRQPEQPPLRVQLQLLPRLHVQNPQPCSPQPGSLPPMQVLQVVPQLVLQLPWSPQPAIPLPRWVRLQWEPQHSHPQPRVRRIPSLLPRVPPPLQTIALPWVILQPGPPPPQVQHSLALPSFHVQPPQTCPPQPG